MYAVCIGMYAVCIGMYAVCIGTVHHIAFYTRRTGMGTGVLWVRI